MRPTLNNLPVRFFHKAELGLDDRQQPSLKEIGEETDHFIQPRSISFSLRDPMMSHYFHFLEIFVLLYALKKEFFSISKVEKIYIGRQSMNNPRQNNIQNEILSRIFPGCEVVQGDIQPHVVSNIVEIDRALARTTINKFLEHAIPICSRWAPSFREDIHRTIGLTAENESSVRIYRPRALYIQRNAPRYLGAQAEEYLVRHLSRLYDVSYVDFAGMSWEMQVRSVAEVDLVVGVHGNGLSNIAWCHNGTWVLELFPDGSHHYDYQILAEIFRLNYLGVERSNIFSSFCRQGPPLGSETDINTVIQSLDPGTINYVVNILESDLEDRRYAAPSSGAVSSVSKLLLPGRFKSR